jgi:hypothetical protein
MQPVESVSQRMTEPTAPRTEIETRDFEKFTVALKIFMETPRTLGQDFAFRTFWHTARESGVEDYQLMAKEEGVWFNSMVDAECEKRSKDALKKRGIESLKRGLEAGADKERKRWEAAGHTLDSPSPCNAGHSAIEEHAATPNVPARTFADAFTLTDVISVESTFADASVVTEPTLVEPEPRNWADEVCGLPIQLPPAVPVKSPRDMSILSSSVLKPFGSLQRRTKRSHSRYSPPHSFNKRQYYSSTYTSHRSQQYRTQVPDTTSLDWRGDPKLSNLSKALESLGWVRREAC